MKVFFGVWRGSNIESRAHTCKNTLMEPHREPLCCRSGRKTKADRSERRYNQLWVLRKKHFAPSFHSSFTSSHLHTISPPPPLPLPPPPPPLSSSPPCGAQCSVPGEAACHKPDPDHQGLSRQTGSRRRSWTRNTNSEMRLTLRHRCGAEFSWTRRFIARCVYVCVSVYECVCRCYWEAWLSPERSSINCEVKEPEGDTRDLH